MTSTVLKNILGSLALAFVCGLSAQADNDTPISVSELPRAAQNLVNRTFSGKKIALAKKDAELLDKSYEIIFTDGGKVEFDRKGNWTEVSSGRSNTSVPSSLVPQTIRNYVASHYGGTRIVKIERDKKGYEVKLSNGIELEFNARLQLVDIDS